MPPRPSSPLHWCLALLLVVQAGDGAAAQWDPFAIAAQRRAAQQELATIDMDLARLVPPAIGTQAHQRLGFHGQPGNPAHITIDLGREVRPDEVVLFAARSLAQ